MLVMLVSSIGSAQVFDFSCTQAATVCDVILEIPDGLSLKSNGLLISHLGDWLDGDILPYNQDDSSGRNQLRHPGIGLGIFVTYDIPQCGDLVMNETFEDVDGNSDLFFINQLEEIRNNEEVTGHIFYSFANRHWVVTTENDHYRLTSGDISFTAARENVRVDQNDRLTFHNYTYIFNSTVDDWLPYKGNNFNGDHTNVLERQIPLVDGKVGRFFPNGDDSGYTSREEAIFGKSTHTYSRDASGENRVFLDFTPQSDIFYRDNSSLRTGDHYVLFDTNTNESLVKAKRAGETESLGGSKIAWKINDPNVLDSNIKYVYITNKRTRESNVFTDGWFSVNTASQGYVHGLNESYRQETIAADYTKEPAYGSNAISAVYPRTGGQQFMFTRNNINNPTSFTINLVRDYGSVNDTGVGYVAIFSYGHGFLTYQDDPFYNNVDSWSSNPGAVIKLSNSIYK